MSIRIFLLLTLTAAVTSLTAHEGHSHGLLDEITAALGGGMHALGAAVLALLIVGGVLVWRQRWQAAARVVDADSPAQD